LSVDRSPGRERISVSRSSRTIPDNASTFFKDPKELARIFAVSVGWFSVQEEQLHLLVCLDLVVAQGWSAARLQCVSISFSSPARSMT
jgi:hypothetical protein